MAAKTIRLPDQWSKHVKSGVLNAISLASVALSYARGRGTGQARLRAGLDQATTEVALLGEELAIKDGRWERAPQRRRPHYVPTSRLRILQLRAARGWTLEETARVFLIDIQTLSEWIRRVDEPGERPLVQTVEPVNRYPDFVRLLVQQLKALFPAMGHARIAQVLGRAGLRLGVTTVRRFAGDATGPEDQGSEPESTNRRPVIARYPGHTWHLDLTAVPTRAGLWVPWLPFSLPQRWPFCWCVAVLVDQFTRACVGFAVFRAAPSSQQIQQFLDRAVRRSKQKPRYILSDRGTQFFCKSFKAWAKRRDIRPRYGRLGEVAGICIIERFILSLKQECTRRLLVPLSEQTLRRELELYATWYNEVRPHTTLDGRTPKEMREDRPPPPHHRFETRPHWRSGATWARELRLDVRYFEGRKHLPIIELRRVA